MTRARSARRWATPRAGRYRAARDPAPAYFHETGATAEHEVFQDFLAGARPEDLPALRHFAACPLCRAMTCIVLGSAASPEASPRELSSRRRRRSRQSCPLS